MCREIWRLVGAVVAALMLWPSEDVRAKGRDYMVFWNVENFFDPYDDSLTLDDEFTPVGTKHWTWNRFLRKRDMIVKVLVSMYDRYGEWPFAVAFAEVENRFVLNQLTQRTILAKLGYGVVHRDSPDSRGIEVALIYREDAFRVLDVETLPVRLPTGRATRDILCVKGLLTHTGDTLHLFVNHWPSRFGGEVSSRPSRQAASDTLSSRIALLTADTAASASPPKVIVTGDFNDVCTAVPVRSLVERASLISLADSLHRKGVGTLKYKGRWELIDLFLVSPALEGARMEIYSHPLLLEEDSQYLGQKPFRTYYGPRWNGGVSDHLPIILEISYL